MSLVIDTHIFVWWFEDPRRLSKAQQSALKKAGAEFPIYLADISLWEVATLVSLRRLRPKIPLREWLDAALEHPHLEVHPISSGVADEVAAIAGWSHKDPADRLIVATARVLGVPLLTSDEVIISSGLVDVVA